MSAKCTSLVSNFLVVTLPKGSKVFLKLLMRMRNENAKFQSVVTLTNQTSVYTCTQV